MTLYRVSYNCQNAKCKGVRSVLMYTDTKGIVSCKRHITWALEEMTLPASPSSRPMATLTVVLLYAMARNSDRYYEEIRKAELAING